MTAKFKVGDRVRCIAGNAEVSPGMGWKEHMEYTVTRVDYFTNICYFGGLNNHGVYEPYLELVEDFHIGDTVRLAAIKNDDPGLIHLIGRTARITGIPTPGQYYLSLVDEDSDVDETWEWYKEELELVTKADNKIKGADNMTRFYKVLKDNYQFKAGAILQGADGGRYNAISDLWAVVDSFGQTGIDSGLVQAEENADNFQRVYAVTQGNKVVYLEKAAAIAEFDTQTTAKTRK